MTTRDPLSTQDTLNTRSGSTKKKVTKSSVGHDAVVATARLTVALERGDVEEQLAADLALVRAVRGDAAAYCRCIEAARRDARRRVGAR